MKLEFKRQYYPNSSLSDQLEVSLGSWVPKYNKRTKEWMYNILIDGVYIQLNFYGKFKNKNLIDKVGEEIKAYLEDKILTKKENSNG